jgi:ABC-type branched-subunit amino acid transport system ATPase component/ABC-type branched-subunit amino acid transport system permease subunit
MNEFFQFVFLGFGLTAVYALLSEGIVLIYQGSGVVNFSQGALALLGAIVFTRITGDGAHSIVLGLVAAIAAGAAAGAVIQLGVMHPLRNASSLARIIATLGVLLIVQAAAALHYSNNVETVSQYLPQHTTTIFGVAAQVDQLVLVGIAAVVTIGLALMYRRTLFGMAMRAAAENEMSAGTLGWSVNRLAVATWTLGGALAGAAGALIVPLTGLSVATIVLLVVPALAAALLGRFSSFTRTFAGALIIGVGQSLLGNYWSQPGAGDAFPFVVIIILLVLTGRSLPVREHVSDRLPSLGNGLLRPMPIVVCTALGIVLMGWVFNINWQDAFTVSVSTGIVLLSIVVLTGYAGQISLAQFALAGLGAYVAGRLVATQGWPYWLAALAGMVAAAPIGVAFALPALRTRGVNLAVVTLGLGVAVDSLLFNNADYTGGLQGTNIGSAKLFGLDVDSINHPGRWGVLVVVLFLIAALVVVNLRRSAGGRRLIAIRENERAAASLGVSVIRSKLYAFALASTIAALGGITIAFAQQSILFADFGPFSSITAASLGVIGGIGYLAGPLAGSTLAAGGAGSLFNGLLSGLANYLVLIGGVLVIVMLITYPDGFVPGVLVLARRLTARLGLTARLPLGRRSSGIAWPADAAPIEQVQVRAQKLELSGLTVRFGPTVAVDDVSFTVEPGEIVGLIGPNGAGKTTLIDAVTGFVPAAVGTIALGGRDLTKRAAHSRVHAGLARSWQSLELFEDISVLENLLVAAEISQRRRGDNVLQLVIPRKPTLTATARAAVAAFELGDNLERKADELPFGRRRAVGIARAVALSPSLLLLDEPAAGLSEHETREFAGLIKQLAERWGMGILIVEHDVEMVMSLCDRIVVLDFGKKIAEGVPADIRRHPAVIAAYLGSSDESAAPVRTSQLVS